MILDGKKALIVGLATNRSIAYGIAKKLHESGAQLAFTYQGDKLKPKVEKMAAQFDSDLVFPCDVTVDEQIDGVFEGLEQKWGKLDILVHSVAFAPADHLEGGYLTNLTRDGFKLAHDVSSYSLAVLTKASLPLMEKSDSGAIITMSYLGAERVVPNYNVMGVAKASLEANMRYLASDLGPKGIRVNAISAGPIRTLAAAGISDFRKMLDYNEQVAPMRKNVTIDEVGNVAAFMCSDLASGITGEVIHVDGGFHSVAMGAME